MAGAPWPELAVQKSIYRQNTFSRTKLTRSYDKEGIKIGLLDDAIQVCIHEDESGTGSPVSKQARLDVVRGELPLKENIVSQEDHS
jgi:hypothetical protein